MDESFAMIKLHKNCTGMEQKYEAQKTVGQLNNVFNVAQKNKKKKNEQEKHKDLNRTSLKLNC